MKTIIMYATGNYSDGQVQEVGRFDSVEDIEIKVGLFSEDVVITFEEENVEQNKAIEI